MVAATAFDPLSTVPDPASHGKKNTDPVTPELAKPLDDKKSPNKHSHHLTFKSEQKPGEKVQRGQDSDKRAGLSGGAQSLGLVGPGAAQMNRT